MSSSFNLLYLTSSFDFLAYEPMFFSYDFTTSLISSTTSDMANFTAINNVDLVVQALNANPRLSLVTALDLPEIATNSAVEGVFSHEKVFPDLPADYEYLDVEVRRRHKKYPHLTAEEVYERMISPGSDGIEMALRLADEEDSLPIDYSNLFTHNGEVIDVTKLSHQEVINLSMQVEDIAKFEALEHIRSTYICSSPNVKLYYPEPFIASPSFTHNDIGFIHILQYQFWLWFLFIFLIVFFFVSFLCVVRWCNHRTQPRRETRGVSRSKCGDLITATVPVTWAISIIVSESTDATDYYDGFGTGELIVGVRAYQWGWHYYYPKHADLSYNVKPNYSAFVGNSLKYTTTTGKKLSTNSLWKFYQTKLDDSVISPAHVLVLPSDNSRILNLMNFKDIGTDTLQASKAFKQIRASSRIYTTNLIHNPSYFTNKYIKFNNLFFNENDLINSNNFGLKRQHTLTSAAATTSINSTFLDRNSLSKLLSYNLNHNVEMSKTNTFGTASDLWSKDSARAAGSNDASTAARLLLEDGNRYNSTALHLISTYPNVIKEFGDNSDNKAVEFPLRKLLKRKFKSPLKDKLSNRASVANTSNLDMTTGTTSAYFNTTLKNTPATSKEFMVNYAFQNVAADNQSARRHENLNDNTTNLNLSLGLNSLDSNLSKVENGSNFVSPLYSYSLKQSNWGDSTVFNKLASNRIMYKDAAPLLTSNPHISKLEYDRTYSIRRKTYSTSSNSFKKWVATSATPASEGDATPIKSSYRNIADVIQDGKDTNITVQDWKKSPRKTIQVLGADRVGEDKAPAVPYWGLYYSNTNTDLRLKSLLHTAAMSENMYLPMYVNYYDYDFRNAQALRLFEDLTWESIYSSYNHLDYLKIYNKYRETYDPKSLGWTSFNSLLLNVDRDYDTAFRFGTNAKSKDLKVIGSYYANSIQVDDYFVPTQFVTKRDLSESSFINDALVMDESYSDQKALINSYTTKSAVALGVYNNYNHPQSTHAVLNNFRADFEDFSQFQAPTPSLPSSFSSTKLVLDTPLLLKDRKVQFNTTTSHLNTLDNDNVEVNPTQSNWSRFSSPIALRRSAKSAMVTYQAFQKVFKMRYEEGRAHVRLTDFADSAITQPYTTEQKIKYEKMLGKTRMQHYNTTFNVNKLLPVFNDVAGLTNSLNYYFFDFPFLDGVTNDPTRHVWFDTFIKYAQREVGGSSVSKYTIAGVPFYKKKFDFNVKQGRQLADTELYFTRIVTARKNYLPQWLYTPYLYSRSNIWFNESNMALLSRSNGNSYKGVRLNLQRMEWYWTRPTFSNTTSMFFTPSFSNSHKSTFRPYVSIQAYTYNLSALTDILSRREYLYRQMLERRNKIVELPLQLRATPKHPLIAEIKSSFLLIDPITYNSEYSREVYYNSLSYFKFMMFKEWTLELNKKVRNLPINLKLVNEYLFFHFLDQPNTIGMGDRESMRKSQFKPLKKGITNMMRLQGTGAVAMPIEIRLQVLASSKDVIHSWAIPSAGIKIDCIPGYTSHRILIFFSPGIYWGQCMEICGRYHHWMPIILYFMKRDLFFLWCTHFLSKKDPYATKFWEANDRQFANYIGFVSYNRSTWLTELGRTL